MSYSLSAKIKTLSFENRNLFKKLAMKKFSLSEDQYQERVLGRTDWAFNHEVILEDFLEEMENGKWKIKRNEETYSLLGIAFPVLN